MGKKYYAFISYSRKNSKAAAYLHKQLEHFRVPVKYVAEENRPTGQKYMRPVFRDRRDLEAGEGSFTSYIQTAIEESRYLIVLCSHESADSIWVNKEIKHFLATHNNDYNAIVPVILNGEPGSGGDAECLPEALRSEEITMRNLPSMIPDEGDDEKTGWENGVVQAMSYMLKVQREKIKATIDAEKVRQAKIYAVIGIAAMIIFALLAGWAIHAERQATANERRAIAGEQEAKKQQKRAENGEKIANENAAEANLFFKHWLSARNRELSKTGLDRHLKLDRHFSHIYKEYKNEDLVMTPKFGLRGTNEDGFFDTDANMKKIFSMIEKEDYVQALFYAKKHFWHAEIYPYVYAITLINEGQYDKASAFIENMLVKNKNSSPILPYRILRAHIYWLRGNIKSARDEYMSMIKDVNTPRTYVAYCYYNLATKCFDKQTKIQYFYLSKMWDMSSPRRDYILYALCIHPLLKQNYTTLAKDAMIKMITILSNREYKSMLKTPNKETMHWVENTISNNKNDSALTAKRKLIESEISSRTRSIVAANLFFPRKAHHALLNDESLRKLERWLKHNSINSDDVRNRFLISLDLAAIKIFENKELPPTYIDCEMFYISLLERSYSRRSFTQDLRKNYIELFIEDISDSADQFFALAYQCKVNKDKERCYAEIRNFLSEFTSDEISRYKELQEIQKKLDGIYDKNTK